MTKKTMSQERKNKIGNVLSIGIIILCAWLLLAVNGMPEACFWFLIIANLASGPICFIAYLREVRSGIFAHHENEDGAKAANV